MAESGIFRTSIGGFNKTDVLRYIDDLQMQAQDSLKALQEQLDQAEMRAKQAEEQAEQAVRRQTELETSFQQENTRLRLQAEENSRKLTSAAQQASALESLRQENQELRKQAEEARLKQQSKPALELELERLQKACVSNWKDSQRLEKENIELRSSLEKARQQIQEEKNAATLETRKKEEEWRARMDQLQTRCAELEAANVRYQDMVGNVGGFIVEIRALGQRFLETAYQRSSACLDTVSGVVESLEKGIDTCQKEMEDVRRELTDQSSQAGMKLEEWVQALETIGQNLPQDGLTTKKC